ncbi:MAG: Transcription initiation factor TFIID subunit 13 [Vezdaea aestivalis]|nr:MAG: Transcription initiation factor TFIID subunit 13 [Vezdaea aestivalis]
MAPRKRAALNFGQDVKLLLYAFGDVKDPLDETSRVLDEIMTEYSRPLFCLPHNLAADFDQSYIVETCHEAAAYASYGRRTKIKVDDFNFVLRRDALKLGRVQNLLSTQAYQAKMRKQFNEQDDSLEMSKKELKDLEKADNTPEPKSKSGRVEKKKKKQK